MADIRKFRQVNGIRQEELANYLGISRSFISLVETARSKMPSEYIAKLINNDMGWDTSCLHEDESTNISASATNNSTARVSISRGSNNSVSGHVIEVAMLKAEIESLKIQLSEEKQRSAQYWEMIQKLMK